MILGQAVGLIKTLLYRLSKNATFNSIEHTHNHPKELGDIDGKVQPSIEGTTADGKPGDKEKFEQINKI